MKKFTPENDFERNHEKTIRAIRSVEKRELPEDLDQRVQERTSELEKERQRGVSSRSYKPLPVSRPLDFIYYSPYGRLAFAIGLIVVVLISGYIILGDHEDSQILTDRRELPYRDNHPSDTLANIDTTTELRSEISAPQYSYAADWRKLEQHLDTIEIPVSLGIVPPPKPTLQHFADTIRLLAIRGKISDFELEFVKGLRFYSMDSMLYEALGDAYKSVGVTENAKAAYWRAEQVQKEGAIVDTAAMNQSNR